MKDYVILTDSCSDLENELREKYDIHYLPMHFTVDGKEYDADLDWKTLSPKEFYDLMRNGKRITTSQVSVNEFKERFTEYAENNFDVLYIGCSSALSASIKAALVAAEDVKEQTGAKIICIDSLQSSYGEGFITIEAAKLKLQGKSIEEVADFAEKEKLKFNQEATVESLHFLKQSGRISAFSAFFGSMLSVKPIIISDALGRNIAVEKVKGRQNSFNKIAERVADEIITEKYKDIYIAHADCEKDVDLLKEILKTKLADKEITFHTGYIGPIVGASTGPGTVIVDFYGKEVEKINN